MNKAAFDKLSAADKQVFLDAAKEAVKGQPCTRGRRRCQRALPSCARRAWVIDVDKAKFVSALGPVNAEFEKQFGKANIDRIRAVK